MEKAVSGYGKIRIKVNEWLDWGAKSLGEMLAGGVRSLGEMILYSSHVIRLFFTRPFRFDELLIHMEFIGNKSVGIISLTGIFTGAAMTYQVYLGFKMVNATSLVGPTVGLGITRELGPVLTGLIIAARAGGAMAARLGTMRVSEQIDALEVMGVEPKQYLISPRVIASLLVTPLLCGVFDATAMTGSWALSVYVLGIDEATFLSQTALWINPSHIYEGLFKSAMFGLFFSIICTFRGFNTSGGAEGVGNATNRGVVLSMVSIIVSDFFLTSAINFFYAMIGTPGGK